MYITGGYINAARRRKKQISKKQVYQYWSRRWKYDFTGESDADFTGVYHWVIQVSKHKRRAIIRKRLLEGDYRKVPRHMIELAKQTHCFVVKSNPVAYPDWVSGFQIRLRGGDKQVLAGKEYDLTYDQVMEFLLKERKKEEKDNERNQGCAEKEKVFVERDRKVGSAEK